jgi:hypothetical protein
MIISGVALAVLVGAGAAFAASGAFNSYTATETFSASAAGSHTHPSPMGFHEVWNAKGLGGHNAAPLTNVVNKIYGMKTNGGEFPTCTANQINKAGSTKGTWNKVCPKGSLIASGPVTSLFVPETSATAQGAPACNPYLSIYNGGNDTQTFFFSEAPFAGSQYTCLGGAVHTGAAAAYTGYITQPSAANHNTWSVKIPQPANVSTSAGGIHGVYASLIKLDVNYKTLTKKVNGKTIGYADSIGCKNGTRPYSTTFTAQNYVGLSPQTQTTTVNNTASCI